MNKANRVRLFALWQQANPAPTTELVYATDFELLIAVLLSAQTTDIAVNKATAPLFAKANTPAALVALGEAGIRSYIRSIGLYKTKAKHIVQACQQLLRDHAGQVPRSRAALEALPGVGRKTANVVLNTAFGEPTIAVDTHIFRVANRTGLAIGATPLAVEKGLLQAVPKPFLRDAHHWMILHGRYVCKARKPLCYECPVAAYCEYDAKTPPDDA